MPLSLREKIETIARTLTDGIDDSYNYSCTCGQGEQGEISCRHCNTAMAAKEKFSKELKKLLNDYVNDIQVQLTHKYQ